MPGFCRKCTTSNIHLQTLTAKMVHIRCWLRQNQKYFHPIFTTKVCLTVAGQFMLPSHSLAEISIRPHHWCTVTVAQSNCSTMTARGARAEPLCHSLSSWHQCQRGHLMSKVLRTQVLPKTNLLKMSSHAAGPRGTARHSSWLTKKNKPCKSRIPRKGWRADCWNREKDPGTL